MRACVTLGESAVFCPVLWLPLWLLSSFDWIGNVLLVFDFCGEAFLWVLRPKVPPGAVSFPELFKLKGWRAVACREIPSDDWMRETP
eukprot:scaffold516_cov270-Pinguiococcus_pyrenoidosus.AAC.1